MSKILQSRDPQQAARQGQPSGSSLRRAALRHSQSGTDLPEDATASELLQLEALFAREGIVLRRPTRGV
ncbi:MAG: hypothetical protein JSS56_05630 [Proteobacteria bacterium]|nr:hypothetical protein [Pseudomonadota bacterium]